MASDYDDLVGLPTGKGTVVVERAAVTAFARAVGDESPVYGNADAARAAGFDGIPAPPTFGFAVQSSGRWPELQPADANPPRDPVAEIMGGLMAGGGIVLHGEQTFEYHGPVIVGQRLHFEGVVRDVYQKTTGDATMTFLVVQDTYCDDEGEPVLTSTMNLIHRG
ncbi:MAG: MaoC family dehydratase N-terminal domain-containing protein [Acidimicrobiales bacterium]